jgi:chromosome segregation ATPase
LDAATTQFEYFKAALAEENPILTMEKIELIQDAHKSRLDIAALHRQITGLEQLLLSQGSRAHLDSGEIGFQDSIMFENEDLKIQNATLKADLAAAQNFKAIESIESELRERGQNYDTIQQENIELQANCQELEQQNQETENECEKLSESLRTATDEIQNWKSLCDSLRQDLSDMKTKEQTLQSELLVLQQKERESMEHIVSLTGERESLKNTVSDLQGIDKRSRREIEKLSARITELESFPVEKNHQKIEELVSQSAKQVALITDFQTEIDEQTKEITQLRMRINELKDSNRSLKVRALAAESAQEDLKYELVRKSTEAEFNDRKSAVEIKNLADELGHFRAQNETLREQLNDHPQKVSQSFISELTRSRQNNDMLLSRLKVIERTDFARENQRLRATSKELEQIRGDNRHLRSLVESLQRANRSIRSSSHGR